VGRRRRDGKAEKEEIYDAVFGLITRRSIFFISIMCNFSISIRLI